MRRSGARVTDVAPRPRATTVKALPDAPPELAVVAVAPAVAPSALLDNNVPLLAAKVNSIRRHT
ncbi:MAG TPA: hypothetical protein VII50_05975 [Acidothermaceae bacterium]